MNDLAARLRAAAWWIVPLAALALVLGLETDWGRELRKTPPAAEPIAAKPVVTALLPDFEIPGGTAARSDTVARTLFNPTRRPAPTLAAEGAKPKIQRGQFTLTGTLVVDGKSTAFLRETSGGKSRRVIQGEQINGMTVADVKPDRVKLTLGDEAEELTLKVALNPKPTALPAGAPAQLPQAPAASQPPGTQAQGQPGGSQTSAESLAARREAARAAAAAAAAATPPAGAAPAPVQPQAASPGAAAAGAGDSSWDAMAQRYRDRAAGRQK
jgi:hypothetical protein